MGFNSGFKGLNVLSRKSNFRSTVNIHNLTPAKTRIIFESLARSIRRKLEFFFFFFFFFFLENHPRCVYQIIKYHIYIYIYVHTVRTHLCYIIRYFTTYHLHVSAITWLSSVCTKLTE